MEAKVYYNEELDLDGTAEELFIQVRNGYFDDNIAGMREIMNIQEIEGEDHRMRYIASRIDRETPVEEQQQYNDEYNTFLMDVEEYKDSIAHTGSPGVQPVPSFPETEYDGITVFGRYIPDDDSVWIGLIENTGETQKSNYFAIGYDFFRKDGIEAFQKSINEAYFYAVEETQEIEENEEDGVELEQD